MKIVVVNGFPRCGKDTFVDFCLNCLGEFGKKYSSVDFVKEIAKKCGWDGEKTPKNRKFLSDLKDLLTEWDDVPFKKVEQFINDFKFKLGQYGFGANYGVVFVMCREPKEIQKLKEKLGAITVCIRRTDAEEKNQSNHADSEVLDYSYDYYIWNDDSLEELNYEAKMFLCMINAL